MLNENKCEPATVKIQGKISRAYVTRTEREQTIGRNRRYLMETTENQFDEPETFYDCLQEMSNSKNSNSSEQFSNIIH